jgi:ribosomal protein S18 acetylase RimI-like enzyme
VRERYPEPDGGIPAATAADRVLVSRIHHPSPSPAPIVAEHPSHLHIDLLPRTQGIGRGRALIDVGCHALADRGSTGVFVGVDAVNVPALGFYRHLGFVDLATSDGAVWLGRRLA